MKPSYPGCVLTDVIMLFCLLAPLPVQAQIVPDRTLPTRVNLNGNTLTIEGGTTAGSNLFHSFSQFSVPTGSTAYFNNALEIQNIISRVTGGSVSNIDGLIRANGSANLFLLNPKGIIFGAKAQLDIKGAFLASTANTLHFADGSQFSATPAQPTTPLLTVSVPIGLGFGQTNGSIVNQSRATDSRGQIVGLQVQPGQTLGLIGGNLSLEGGHLTASGGRIELGAVAGAGFVSLTPTPPYQGGAKGGFALGYEGVQNFQDIQLSKAASVNASGEGGGQIQVRGGSVTLTQGSSILADTLGSQDGRGIAIRALHFKLQDRAFVSASTFAQGAGGGLTVAASSVELIGNGELQEVLNKLFFKKIDRPSQIGSGLFSLSFGSGNAGNLTIDTGRLSMREGAFISTATFGNGDGGDLAAKVSDSVELIASELFADNFGDGYAGKVTVQTGTFRASEGGALGSSTFGAGQGGTLTIRASDRVELAGTTPDGQFKSGLFANAYSKATGAAGNINIETRQLTIREGAGIGAATFGAGRGGTITIKASDWVELIGRSPSLASEVSNLATMSEGTGGAGDIKISTGQLVVRDGASVSTATSKGEIAGNIEIDAGSLLVDNQAAITAETEAGVGGNITLRSQNLQLRHNSQINTMAGGTSNGGNININTNTIVALENSNITANAFKGRGGNIGISVQRIFLSPDSKITASSELGIDGTVEIKSPDIDLQSALNPLEATFVGSEEVIAGSCLARRNTGQGSFTVTGTGGLPRHPYDAIRGEYKVSDVQGLPLQAQQQASSLSPNPQAPMPKPWKLGDPIQEAQGMTVTADGRILVGTAPQRAATAKAEDIICH
jgi:filamentous hemagglutinin family protein